MVLHVCDTKDIWYYTSRLNRKVFFQTVTKNSKVLPPIPFLLWSDFCSRFHSLPNVVFPSEIKLKNESELFCGKWTAFGRSIHSKVISKKYFEKFQGKYPCHSPLSQQFRAVMWKLNTVKPLYNGHHWNLIIVPVIERCRLHRGSSQIGLISFKSLL